MRGGDLRRWRRVLGITQQEAAAICGYAHKSPFKRMESNADATPPPRWLGYVMAWTYLYGTRNPFGPHELPLKMRELRQRFALSRPELAAILDVAVNAISECERETDPMDRPYIAFAVAWITLYGTRLPFPEAPRHLPQPGRGSKPPS